MIFVQTLFSTSKPLSLSSPPDPVHLQGLIQRTCKTPRPGSSPIEQRSSQIQEEQSIEFFQIHLLKDDVCWRRFRRFEKEGRDQRGKKISQRAWMNETREKRRGKGSSPNRSTLSREVEALLRGMNDTHSVLAI